MTAFTDLFENRLVDGMFRTGATAWATGTPYVLGQLVYGNTTGGAGKIMECTTAGTSHASTEPTWPSIATTPNTVADNTVTWTIYAVGAPKRPLWAALLTAAPSDTGGGTEVSGGSYARVNVPNTNVALARTNAAADTGVVSSGTTGTTSNNAAITFPAPTGNWGVCTHFGFYDAPTAGNLIVWAALTASKTVNNGDAAPSFAISALTLQVDN